MGQKMENIEHIKRRWLKLTDIIKWMALIILVLFLKAISVSLFLIGLFTTLLYILPKLLTSLAPSKVHNKNLFTRSKNEISSLIEVPVIDGFSVYLPWKNAPCLLMIKGFRLIGIGMISLSTIPENACLNLEGVFTSLRSLGLDITYLISCRPEEGRLWKAHVLFIIRNQRITLRISSRVVKDVVDEIIRGLDWVRSALLATTATIGVEVLSGMNLVEALEEVISGYV